MNKMNEKNKKVGCHCEENISSTKQSSTPVLNQCVNNICTIGRKVEYCRVGVSHLLAMTRSGRSLEKIFKKIFRDDSSFSTPTALMHALTIATLLSFIIISDSLADGKNCNCYYCGGCCMASCCMNGTVLIDRECVEANCSEGKEVFKGTCVDKCLPDQERSLSGNCLPKCPTGQTRNSQDVCISIPTCHDGYACRNYSGDFIENCCYKTDGDTTTLYPDNPSQGFAASGVNNLPDNKNLIISSEAYSFACPGIHTSYKNVYISEGATAGNDCTCCLQISPDLKFIIPDSGNIGMKGKINNGMLKIVCLGDIDKCREDVGTLNEVVAPTESQCNTSGSYYYTGNSCEHRPDNPADMVCTGGYAKLKNNCVDPLKTFAKKRYTPAEAAQWLKDDDNEITITFKK